jgi:predicted CxxxxCH...CXXCH cytochrome family protein
VFEDVDPTSVSTDYAFGCGFCHPTDPARHVDGALTVELDPASGVSGGLRSRNAADAAYDRVARTCSGVSCHSSGQTTPAFVVAPDWRGGPISAGCFGCHGNPPDYPNGGVGSPTANGHLNYDNPANVPYAATWGHTRSSHSFPHGGEWDDSVYASGWGSPRTCQTCHFDTVDPANTAPGGFMYLDTTVKTELSLNPYSNLKTLYACQTCHTGAPGAPPTGTGRALPLRHVNGRRDVVFDPRTEVPDGYAPAALWWGGKAPRYREPQVVPARHLRPAAAPTSRAGGGPPTRGRMADARSHRRTPAAGRERRLRSGAAAAA